MKLYCLSGLGIDERAFKNVRPEGIELVHIEWIDPLPKESLAEYSARLFARIDPEDSYNLLGLSFGGMVAAEFARIKPPGKLFLVSTISASDKLQIAFKIGIFCGLHRWLPSALLAKPNRILYFLFGANTSLEQRIVRQFVLDTDLNYIKWALKAITSWKGQKNIRGIKIHGSNDKLLPLRGNADYLINGGTHFMIFNRGKEIAKIIEKELQSFI